MPQHSGDLGAIDLPEGRAARFTGKRLERESGVRPGRQGGDPPIAHGIERAQLAWGAIQAAGEAVEKGLMRALQVVKGTLDRDTSGLGG